jgi:hypothetical protein
MLHAADLLCLFGSLSAFISEFRQIFHFFLTPGADFASNRCPQAASPQLVFLPFDKIFIET